MTSPNEQFYDEEISPALAALARRCHDHGMSFVASVEFELNCSGSTVALTEQHGSGIRTTAYAARSNSNIDAMFVAIINRAKEVGHSSIFLAQLGVPHTPETKGDAA